MKKLLTVVLIVILSISSGFLNIFAQELNQVDQFYNVVVFIRFQDEATYEAPFGTNHYEELFNGVDTASLRDYFLEVTYNQLTIDSLLPLDQSGQIIYFTDVRDRSYYEPYDTVENSNGYQPHQWADREQDLLARATDYIDSLGLIDPSIDLDVNKDGMMDSITFMVSGEDSGWNTLLWPHKWEFYKYYNSAAESFDYGAPEINGINPYYYTLELLGNSQNYDNQVDVGVLAHETFHLLSAPDLYHYYNYLDVEPVGDWGLMENTGVVPSHMLGYMKYQYGGWINSVTEITESGNYTLYPLQESPSNLYRIETNYPGEYIYLEYRDDIGLYESNLPDTGLLVYRVNTNVIGNEVGSYDNGIPSDEVWIYRPGMDDTVPPIIIEDADGIDGYIDDAALSDTNIRDSVGLGTDVDIFSSEGHIINITISNVVEQNGYVTFDLFMEPSINLDLHGLDIKEEQLILYDSHLMEYEVNISNIPTNFDVYYTLDGTEPNQSSTLYTESFFIDAANNYVRLALYDGDTFVLETEQYYAFQTTLESNHEPYGNDQELFYFLDFGTEVRYQVEFNPASYLEDGYDFLTLSDGTSEYIFTGNEMDSFVEIFTSEYIIFEFETDYSESDFYGFEVLVEPLDDVSLTLVGGSEIYVEVFDSFVDEVTLESLGDSTYSVVVDGVVDTNIVGTYIITYTVINDTTQETVLTKTRTVIVKDTEAPTVTLNGEEHIILQVGDVWEDPFITISDNYDTEFIIETKGSVDTSGLDFIVLEYFVYDQSGNMTYITRTVEVIDTIAPEVVLNEGIDTIYLGEVWTDGGVTATDNLSTSFDIVVSEFDSTEPGTYHVTYTVSDAFGNETEVTRVVTILEPLEEIKEVTCTNFRSTFTEGDIELIPPTCNYGTETMTLMDYEVGTVPGIYELVYTFETETTSHTKVVYYSILPEEILLDYTLYIEKRRELV